MQLTLYLFCWFTDFTIAELLYDVSNVMFPRTCHLIFLSKTIVTLMFACNLQEVEEDRWVCCQDLTDNPRNIFEGAKSRYSKVILASYKLTLKLKET